MVTIMEHGQSRPLPSEDKETAMTVNLLQHITKTPANANTIAEAAGISPENARKLLKGLRDAGSVAFEKQGGEFLYHSKEDAPKSKAATSTATKGAYDVSISKDEKGWSVTCGEFKVTDAPTSQAACRRIKKAMTAANALPVDSIPAFDKDWRIALSTVNAAE